MEPRRMSLSPPPPDEVRTEYIMCVSEMLSHVRSLFSSIICENTEVRVTIGLVAAILHRVSECAASVLILAEQNRARDMAVLLLNLMELRIDLQYIALSEERESEWLEHVNEWRKPWNLDSQLKEIFQNPKERQAEVDIYHIFSMIKHGSPAKSVSWLSEMMNTEDDVSGVAFSITCDGKKLNLDPQDFSYMTGILLFHTGINAHDGAQAACRVLSKRDISFASIADELAIAKCSLSAVLERDCMRGVVQWVGGRNPEFGKLCSEVERLKAERDELAKDL